MPVSNAFSTNAIAYIRQLEAFLKLTTLRKFASSTEALPGQNGLFDEAELEAAFEDAGAELPEQEPAKPRGKTRQRGFAPSLPRIRVEHTLSNDVRAQAIRTFFHQGERGARLCAGDTQGTGALAGAGRPA